MRELLLSLKDSSFGFSKNKIFENISVNINNRDKIALVGKNGVGKTTLMDIFSKKKIIDLGDTWFMPNLSIGYLSQKEKLNFSGNTRDLIKKLCEKETNFEFKLKQYAQELKLNLDLEISSLSGGLKRKVLLIELLIKNPKLLLLDEPTNHLDIESIIWLENFLIKEFTGAFLIVSHDKEFLEKTTNKVFWLDRKNLKISPKGFHDFENWSNQIIEHEKKVLKNKNSFLREELGWLSKGIKARRKRNIKRKNQVKELENELQKEQSDFIKSITKVKLRQLEDNQNLLGPNVVASFHNVSKSYINKNEELVLFKKFNFKLHRGEKIGLIGKNGSGKSTMFKLLNGDIKADFGSVKIKPSIDFSYFDQMGDQFCDKKSIKENLIPGGGDYIDVNGIKKHICGYIKNFLFDPSDINNLVSTLSGGQRNRLLLAKVLANPRQLMILDEPTNDLDSDTLDILIDFINDYKGTVLISSHDRKFLDETTEKVFYFSGNGEVDLHLGSCSEILEKIKNKKPLEIKKKKSQICETKIKINYKKEIEKILKDIQKIEKKIIAAKLVLEDSELFQKDKIKFEKIVNEISHYEKDLLLLEKKWILLEEKNLTQ